jgi:hypothetical protein
MKLLTFLGTGRYDLTCYHWNEHRYDTRFSPVASCSFLAPSELILFLTHEAEEQVLPEFRSEFSTDIPLCVVPVPLGRNEDELWEIFNQISAQVKPHEQVAFDITNGLRSFPLVGLMAAVFLHSALKVDVRHVFYGAFDVGRVTTPGMTPIFDLSPMLSLLDWSVAAERFNKTGDGRALSSLVSQQRKALAQAVGVEQAGALGNLANMIAEISRALSLIRVYRAMDMSAGLVQRIDRARPALSLMAATQPFQLLLDTVGNTYAPIGLADPEDPAQALHNLDTQRKMLAWYAEREHWVQAITVARELLVSWFMAYLGHFDFVEREKRESVEEVVNTEAHRWKNVRKLKGEYQPIFLASVPCLDEALSLWNDLVGVRNDVDHAGMRKNPLKPEDLVSQMETILKRIYALPLPERNQR